MEVKREDRFKNLFPNEPKLTEILYNIMKERIFRRHMKTDMTDIGTTKAGKPVNVYPLEKDFILENNQIGFTTAKAAELARCLEYLYGPIFTPSKDELNQACADYKNIKRNITPNVP